MDSSKQPFTAQNTAEAKLLSTMTGFSLGTAHQSLALRSCAMLLIALRSSTITKPQYKS